MISEQTSSKREAYETIYQDITAIQESYRSMVLNCSHQLWHDESSEEDMKSSLQRNIDVAEDSLRRLERIKYFASLAILTEGSVINEEDLTSTITELDDLLEVADQETKIQDQDISAWATNKRQYLDNIKEVLLQILNDKVLVKVKRERIMYQ